MSSSDKSTNDRPVDVAMAEALLMLLRKRKRITWFYIACEQNEKLCFGFLGSCY